jgi:hypothetical protein
MPADHPLLALPDAGLFSIRDAAGAPVLERYGMALLVQEDGAERRIELEVTVDADGLLGRAERIEARIDVRGAIDAGTFAAPPRFIRHGREAPLFLERWILLYAPATGGRLFHPQGPGALRVFRRRADGACRIHDLCDGETARAADFLCLAAKESGKALRAQFLGPRSCQGALEAARTIAVDAPRFEAALALDLLRLDAGESCDGPWPTLHLSTREALGLAGNAPLAPWTPWAGAAEPHDEPTAGPRPPADLTAIRQAITDVAVSTHLAGLPIPADVLPRSARSLPAGAAQLLAAFAQLAVGAELPDRVLPAVGGGGGARPIDWLEGPGAPRIWWLEQRSNGVRRGIAALLNSEDEAAVVEFPVARLGLDSARVADAIDGTELGLVVGAAAFLVPARSCRLLEVVEMRTVRQHARDDSARPGATLTLDHLVPGVLALRWDGPLDRTEEVLEEVARAETSLCAGSHVILRPPTPAPGILPAPLPSLLGRLLGHPFAIARDRASDRLTLAAPATGLFTALPDEPDPAPSVVTNALREGGLLLLSVADEARHRDLCDRLADRAAAGDLREACRSAQRTALESGRRRDAYEASGHPRLGSPLLDVGDATSEAHYHYTIAAGGELVAEGHGRGQRRIEDLGRLVRGSEQWSIPLAGEEGSARQLVLIRRTSPADRGKLVRVMLDDEDLGPWKLGAGGGDGWSHDRFFIASELWRDRAAITLRLELQDPELRSYRIQFLTEAEPAGLWLTDLEPARIEAEPANVLLHEAPGGEPLTIDGALHLRGILCRGTARLQYRIPKGYRWFDAQVGIADHAAERRESGFRVRVDGRTEFQLDGLTECDGARPVRVRLDDACTLELEHRGPGHHPGVFAAPLLVRAPRRTPRHPPERV